ncbi:MULTISPECIES: hypothetical protein [Cytobacillus]|uniref:DUF2187 domain-containing protein n=1 Tax=Cytobacillus kochii TaxID=859143 RepID=A0A248THI7_9BACI|nr:MULTISPECIES: hypothetical protein [Cytobacillus]ASV67582.1 hypothetical protein CKF48_09765 [Cytobacillus kochii]MDQ0186329.1 hypothetical protein [Cytobacillus kochii]MEA1855595.1 hypothetical protein [Cytobacillus sp. OWB-43]
MFSKIPLLDSKAKVKVIFDDDSILIGVVDHWTSPGDSEKGVEELTIVPTQGNLKGNYINFDETEVKSIEVID